MYKELLLALSLTALTGDGEVSDEGDYLLRDVRCGMRRRAAGVVPILLLFTLGCSVQGERLSPEDVCGEYWMGVYLQGYKVGFSHVSLTEDKGSPHGGFRILSESRLSVSVLGQQMQTDVVTVERAAADLAPTELDCLITSGGRSTRVLARFTPGAVRCTVTSGDQTTEQTVPIAEDVTLEMDPELMVRARHVELDKTYAFHFFNPLTLSIEKGTLRGLGWEQIEHRGQQVKAFAVELEAQSIRLTNWVDESGEVLQISHPLGLRFVRQPKEEAIEGETRQYLPAPDLASVAKVVTKEVIDKPRTVSLMRVRIEGLNREGASGDGRQRVLARNNGALTLEVSAPPLAETGAALPLEDDSADEYLGSTTYLNASAPEIKSLAASIVGGEKDSAVVVRLLGTWVYENLRPRGDMGVIRAATDVLETRSGVCRDYAALYSALARAAGVPTRLVGGLCYWRDGFYYHAWAESYLGEWVAVDPTIAALYADATHIKLIEGDLTDLFAMGGFIGGLKIEVEEAK